MSDTCGGTNSAGETTGHYCPHHLVWYISILFLCWRGGWNTLTLTKTQIWLEVGCAQHYANTHSGEGLRCPPESKCHFNEGSLESTYVQVRYRSLVSVSSRIVFYITLRTRRKGLLAVTGRMHCIRDNFDSIFPAGTTRKAVIGSKVHLTYGESSKTGEVKGRYLSIYPLCKTDNPSRPLRTWGTLTFVPCSDNFNSFAIIWDENNISQIRCFVLTVVICVAKGL